MKRIKHIKNIDNGINIKISSVGEIIFILDLLGSLSKVYNIRCKYYDYTEFSKEKILKDIALGSLNIPGVFYLKLYSQESDIIWFYRGVKSKNLNPNVSDSWDYSYYYGCYKNSLHIKEYIDINNYPQYFI